VRSLVVVLLVVAACGGGGHDALPAGQGTVVRVIDGDTVVVRIADVDEHVRLIGVDTPETKKPDHPVECYGEEASRRTSELLPAGTIVRLERDKEARDRYGRLLAYVYRVTDGLFVEQQLLDEGMGDVLVIRPNDAHEGSLAEAAASAHRAGTGLWSACGGNHVSGSVRAPQ